ncbi:MAG: YkvA family protein [Trueperaceae bacterium]
MGDDADNNAHENRDEKTGLELANRYAGPKDYDEDKFWKTVGRHAAKWGGAMLLQALTLYYCMIDPATPAKSKAIIAGALAYTVFPADLIPDLIPAVGWGDDAAIIGCAGYEVISSINEKHRTQARAKVDSLLGSKPRSAEAQ